jgi:hypothetical protein
VFLAGVLAVGTAGCQQHSLPASSRPGDEQTQEENEMSVSTEDLQGLVQSTIDLPQLQAYYHVDQAPERKPLVVVRNDAVDRPLQLSKFGEPVEVLTADQAAGRPHLEITRLSVKGTEAEVEFRYPVEGVGGTVQFHKTDSGWQVASQRIVER